MWVVKVEKHPSLTDCARSGICSVTALCMSAPQTGQPCPQGSKALREAYKEGHFVGG